MATYVFCENKCKHETDTVKVSSTQPTDGEKIWLQKGENIFNPETDIEFADSFRECETGTVANSTNHYGLKIKVNPNTTYVTYSDIKVGEWSNLCFFDADMHFISGDDYTTENKVFTTPNNCAYVTMALLKSYTYFHLEENIKKIYVKNDDGGYEEFYNNSKIQNYSTEEQVIGTWIDGKPLYRKIIYGNAPVVTDGSYTSASFDIANNVGFAFIENAWINDTTADGTSLCPLPYVIHNGIDDNKDVKHLITNGKYRISSNLNYFNDKTFTAIIKYTKTTD